LGTKLGQNTKLQLEKNLFYGFKVFYVLNSIDLGEDNEISRFYTPISAVDQKGIVEFVLKEIKDINTLSMSQMLSKLNVIILHFFHHLVKNVSFIRPDIRSS
jgi:hypothetical protein